MRILLILIFLCSTANAALTPNKLPKTKTGGSSPTLQDSVIYDDGTNVGIGTTTPVGGFVVTNGNVGIGTWVPLQKLQVIAGNIGIETSSANSTPTRWIGSSSIQSLSFDATSGAVLNSLGSMLFSIDSNANDTTRRFIFQRDQDRFASTDTAAGTALMVIQESGNVGIATFAPNALLDISSTAAQDLFRVLDNGSGDTSPFVIDSSGNIGIGLVTPLALTHIEQTAAQDSFRVNDQASDTTPFIINSEGNVGIGISSPSSKFHSLTDSVQNEFVVETTTSGNVSSSLRGYSSGTATTTQSQSGSVVELRDKSGTNFGFSTIGFQDNGGSNLAMISGVMDDTTANSGSLDLITASSGARGVRVKVGSSGNVGIGTIVPTSLLHVQNTAAIDSFRVNDQANDTTPFIIDSTGNIGIGSQFPSAKVDIFGATAASLGIKINSGVTNNPRFDLFHDGTYGYIRANSDAGTNYNLSLDGNIIRFQQYSGGWVERMRIHPGGNVGISTDAPNALLDISSTAAQDLFRVNDNGSGDTTPFLIDSVGNVGIGSVTPSSILDIDIGTGVGQVTINGSTGGCLMIRDTDDAGWTECDVLDGVMTCSIDADGICD